LAGCPQLSARQLHCHPHLSKLPFLYLKEKRGVGNKTYNNYRGYFSIIFNFYISGQELPIKNPITKVKALTVEASELHLPFSNAQLSSIQEKLLAKGDKQLLLFISFIYYTFARPAEGYFV
jgi:hypothetical protein